MLKVINSSIKTSSLSLTEVLWSLKDDNQIKNVTSNAKQDLSCLRVERVGSAIQKAAQRLLR